MTSQLLVNIRWWKVTRPRNLNGSSVLKSSPLDCLRPRHFHPAINPPEKLKIINFKSKPDWTG